MKCQNCDGNGRFEVEDNGVVMQGVYWRCPNCGGKGVVEPMTNEEWLKQCTTEQLADKLTDFSFWLVPTIPSEDKREQIRKKIVEWLKEIHK